MQYWRVGSNEPCYTHLCPVTFTALLFGHSLVLCVVCLQFAALMQWLTTTSPRKLPHSVDCLFQSPPARMLLLLGHTNCPNVRSAPIHIYVFVKPIHARWVWRLFLMSISSDFFDRKVTHGRKPAVQSPCQTSWQDGVSSGTYWIALPSSCTVACTWYCYLSIWFKCE
jgi:hypothetical protein